MPAIRTRHRRTTPLDATVSFYGYDYARLPGTVGGNVGSRDQQIPFALMVSAFSGAAAGFNPTQIGAEATVSGSTSTWKDTSIVIPATSNYGLVEIDLAETRGVYLVSWVQWRAIPTRAVNSAVEQAHRIPLTRAFSFDKEVSQVIGRRGNGRMLVAYTGGETGVANYTVRAYTIA